MLNKRKIIFTIDVDAFFAQAEEKRNPNYLNKSIGIGFLLNNKGVLTTCNYLARKRGIYSGQPIYKAMQMDPKMILVKPDYEYYTSLSEIIFSTISKFTNKMEVASVDECFIDVTNKIKIDENPIDYARKIQDEIFRKTKITVSIGISENKILSKIASNFKKPFGISTLFKSELKEKLWPLNISEMYGIGFRTAIKLRALEINTIEKLAKINEDSYEYQILRKQIGINLKELIKRANGIDNSEISNSYHFVKSLSYVKTFPFPVKDYEELKREIFEICKIIISKLEYRNLLCKVVGIQTKNEFTTRRIKFRDESFKLKDYSTTQKTLKFPTNNLEVIYAEAISLLDNWYKENIDVNYIGIKVTNFVEKFFYGEQQFIENELEKNDDNESTKQNEKDIEIKNLVNYLNQKIGKEVFSTAYNFSKIKRFHDKSYSSQDTIKFKRWK